MVNYGFIHYNGDTILTTQSKRFCYGSDKYHHIPAPPYFIVQQSIAAFEDACSSTDLIFIECQARERTSSMFTECARERMSSMFTECPYTRDARSALGLLLIAAAPCFPLRRHIQISIILPEEQDGVLNRSYLNIHGNVFHS